MRVFPRDPSGRHPGGGGGLKALAKRPETLWIGLALVLLVLVFVGWLGYGAMHAKSSLEQSRTYAQQAKDALLSGKAGDGARLAENAEFHARQARSSVHSLPWNIAAAVAWLGSPFKAGQQISDVVVGLTTDVLKPAAEAGVGISPDTLFANGRVNLPLLREKEPTLSALSADATRLADQASAITEPAYISALGDARSQLQDQTSDIAGLFRNAALAARLAPSMMGDDAPRTYLVGFQTPAEARGTGGLLGGFGILRFDKGIPVVDSLASNTGLTGASAAIDLGLDFNALFGFTNPYGDFRNSNLSSHFPYAAQIWKSMWEQQSGTKVDGVVVIDPVALSYLLGAIGPVTMPDGEAITQENVVELTMSTVYKRFPLAQDQPARKNYLQQVAKAVVLKASGYSKSPRKLLDALGKAFSARRIAVWSAFPAEQKLLEETPLAHAIPEDSAPYAEVIINNLGGNKMDYYLKREIEYVADDCEDDVRYSTTTVRLANTATGLELPELYAVFAPSQVKEGDNRQASVEAPVGTMMTSVRLVATTDAKLMGVTIGDKSVPAVVHTERGHPSFEVQVLIPPGQSGELVFRLSEPTSPGAPRVPIQPLIDSVTPQVSVPECPR